MDKIKLAEEPLRIATEASIKAHEAGQEDERAKIVAWLRKYSVINGERNDEHMADDIEAGAHLK